MRVLAVVGALIGVALAASCSGSTTRTSKAQWFDACNADNDCAQGSCLCGVCTQTCEDDGACASAGGPAACVSANSACAGSDVPPTGGVCVATCSADEDCPARSVCRAGSCQRDSSSGSGGASADGGPNAGGATSSGGRRQTGGASASGGATGSGGASGGRPSASDFADVDVPQNFTNPVSLPPPVPELTGDLESLVGVWVERNYNGTPCTPAAAGNDIAGTVCTRLELVKNANGTYSGTMSRQASKDNAPPVAGPFAPATNFEVGYPAEIQPEEYGFVRDFTPGIAYRVFDGVYRDAVLSFWISPLDVWQEWCAAQKPHPWDIDGRKEYRCVPQTADESNTDQGKLALCTSAEDLPMCRENVKDGVEVPCVCLDPDTGYMNFARPLCSLSFCECSPTSCVAYTRNTSITAHFEHEGDVLRGYVTVMTPDAFPMDLVRISP